MWFWSTADPSADTPAPAKPPSTSSTSDASACPVDHKARAVWLEEARRSQSTPKNSSVSSPSHRGALNLPHGHPSLQPLSADREISTIPRSTSSSTTPAQSSYHTRTQPIPANAEIDSGADAKSGNWIYPSEKMFFDAMRRKQHDPRAEDMRSVVPIHNAVNERAWAQIKAWERPYDSSSCGGPKLVSFQGSGSTFGGGTDGSREEHDAGPGWWEVVKDANLTPRAKWTVLTGAKPPFDRHDWVVERCKGERVEYVIDFYSGKQGRGANGLSFYLDVRPKLNSFEGWKMRANKALGLT